MLTAILVLTINYGDVRVQYETFNSIQACERAKKVTLKQLRSFNILRASKLIKAECINLRDGK